MPSLFYVFSERQETQSRFSFVELCNNEDFSSVSARTKSRRRRDIFRQCMNARHTHDLRVYGDEFLHTVSHSFQILISLGQIVTAFFFQTRGMRICISSTIMCIVVHAYVCVYESTCMSLHVCVVKTPYLIALKSFKTDHCRERRCSSTFLPLARSAACSSATIMLWAWGACVGRA